MGIISKTDRAYMAGIIDGEGCITLSKKEDPTCRSASYRLYVAVSNTKRPLLEYLKTTTGLGQIVHRRPPTINSKDAYVWQVWSQQARSVLEEVIPFLRLKQKQAKIGIQYAKTMTTKYGIKGLPKSIQKSQKRSYERMRKLNKRGR